MRPLLSSGHGAQLLIAMALIPLACHARPAQMADRHVVEVEGSALPRSEEASGTEVDARERGSTRAELAAALGEDREIACQSACSHAAACGKAEQGCESECREAFASAPAARQFASCVEQLDCVLMAMPKPGMRPIDECRMRALRMGR